jgi:ketosteroid isomerase-like protein
LKLKRPIIACVLILLSGFRFSAAQADQSNEDAGTAIRMLRANFNQAIVDKNVDAITPILAPGYHLVTGRGQQLHGIEEKIAFLKSVFSSKPDFFCQRDLRELRVNQRWGLAEELGDWNCYETVQSELTHSSGVYAAKWHRSTEGSWLLRSEVFTTMNCEGSQDGCSPPDPIE